MMTLVYEGGDFESQMPDAPVDFYGDVGDGELMYIPTDDESWWSTGVSADEGWLDYLPIETIQDRAPITTLIADGGLDPQLLAALNQQAAALELFGGADPATQQMVAAQATVPQKEVEGEGGLTQWFKSMFSGEKEKFEGAQKHYGLTDDYMKSLPPQARAAVEMQALRDYQSQPSPWQNMVKTLGLIGGGLASYSDARQRNKTMKQLADQRSQERALAQQHFGRTNTPYMALRSGEIQPAATRFQGLV